MDTATATKPSLPLKRRIHAGIFEIRLFNDDLRSIARAQFDVFGQVLKQLALTLVPLLWMLIPFAIVIPQLQFRYGYSGLRPGEATLLEVTMRGGAEGKDRPLLLPSWQVVLLAVLAMFLLMQTLPLLIAKSKRRAGTEDDNVIR